MQPLSEYTPAALAAHLAAAGFRPTHAPRILRAYYAVGGGEVDWNPLRLPRALAELLSGRRDAAAPGSGGLAGGATAAGLRTAPPDHPVHAALAARQVAEDGTTKLLLRLADGRTVETVMMPDARADRAAGCVSSQVGCAMGCDFCATTQTGFERNLTSGEIVEQFLALRREALALGRRLHTLVFMGMGEPLLNLDAVLAAVQRIADNALGGLGWRQVTVSTVGIVPGIDALAASGLNVHLAVSLHAPDDATRAKLLPMGRRFGVDEILAAADRYQARTGRPVILQYCLLRGVNDSLDQADQLAGRLEGRRMHVNLLRYNPTGLSLRGVVYAPSPERDTDEFLGRLRARGVVAHVRRPRGRDIDAACGQLRRRAGDTPVLA